MNKIPKPEIYKGIYNTHKYWGKKPANIIRYYIERFSSKGDKILDPFSGSGVSAIEASLTGRVGIGIDINHIAIELSSDMLTKVDIKRIKDELKKIKKTVDATVNEFYATNFNGERKIASHFVWQENKLIEVWIKEGHRTISKNADKLDLQIIDNIQKKDIPYYFPDRFLKHNTRINANKGQRVSDLFTKRNLYILSFIYNEIKKIKEESLRRTFLLAFTASLGQASKMVFVVSKRKGLQVKKQVGSWVIGYWIPKEHFEINPLTCFENRINRIIKAKQELDKLPTINIHNKISELSNTSLNDIILIEGSSQNALKKFKDNSIDYIITDPPHGNRIPYLELSEIWNSWLDKDSEFTDEMIISESKEREKDSYDYFKIFQDVLSECKRVLKPKKILTLMFNSLDDETWLNLINLLNIFGFKIKEIETLEYSANSVVQDNRSFGLKNDLVFHLENCDYQKKQLFYTDEESEKKLINKYMQTMKEHQIDRIQILNDIIIEMIKENNLIRISTLIKFIKNIK